MVVTQLGWEIVLQAQAVLGQEANRSEIASVAKIRLRCRLSWA